MCKFVNFFNHQTFVFSLHSDGSKDQTLPPLQTAPPAVHLYAEAGSQTFTLPLPAEPRVAAGDKLVWKRNGDVVYRKDARTNRFTVSSTWALELPAEALRAVTVDVYTVVVYDQNGRVKLKRTTTLHLLAGTTAVTRDMCLQAVV